MTNYRVLPPAAAPFYQNMTINGRNYAAVPGGSPAFLDVPDFDMPELRANGWVVLGIVGDLGSSDAPPSLVAPTDFFLSTDGENGAQVPVWWDGATWRNALGNEWISS